MKLVVAFIQPFRLDAVREALAEIGVNGMTITEVRGFGRQKGQVEVYRGTEYAIHYIPKLKVEVAVNDRIVDHTVTAIAKGAKTGAIGDGKVFVIPIEMAQRIRTGETGEDAL